ncbi:MAG: carbohydrate ABC transporter permease [Roseiflexaceae bacterium]|jgi:ABC-type glycerol-3-phosphate transport system permease component|nr:carbohydrate ABC transporter permease [Chloroflexaceae bacterium]MCE2853994.1 carbohydrate ABC transporter permease [Chloroflexaceae bacterium]
MRQRIMQTSPSLSQRVSLIGIYLFMIVLSLFCLIPFVWPLLSAFSIKPENVSGLYLYWPDAWTLKGFDDAIFGRGKALILLRNSLITTVGGVGLAVIFSALGGYTLSRSDFRFKRALMYAFLLIQIIPSTATILPFFIIMRELRLVDSLFGVTIGLTAAQIPFLLWVMKGFFDEVPRELEESAALDGATRWGILWHVMLPLSLPGLGAASVLAFNSAWSAFFMPLILLSSPDKFLLPLGLFRSIIGYTNIDYRMMNAMSIIYFLPSLLFFVLARRYLVRGMMAGAMAGN